MPCRSAPVARLQSSRFQERLRDLPFTVPCRAGSSRQSSSQPLQHWLRGRSEFTRASACSCCSGSFHFTPIMLPQIAWCDQLVLDEDRLGNWNSLREHVQSECDELFSISPREIGY